MKTTFQHSTETLVLCFMSWHIICHGVEVWSCVFSSPPGPFLCILPPAYAPLAWGSSLGSNPVLWAFRAEPQYLDRLRHEIYFFLQKILRTIHTYHLVPFKLPKIVQGGPFQGLLVFKHFFPKIPNFTKYALTPSFFGRSSSVIPFRKALAIPVAGPYWSLSW